MQSLRVKFNYLSYQNILFTLFLVSGAIKFLFIYINFPIDITLVLFILVLWDSLLNIHVGIKRLNTNRLFFISLFISLIFISIVSLTFSPSDTYKYIKVLSLFISLLGFIYPLFIIQFDLKLFFKTVMLTIIPCAIIFIIAKQIHWYGINFGVPYEIRLEASKIKGSYLSLSDFLAMSSLYMVYRKKYVYSIFFLLLVFALGAKGSLIFTIFIIFLWKVNRIMSFSINKKRLKILLLFLMTGTLSIILFNEKIYTVLKIGFHRFSQFFKPSVNVNPEIHSRSELFEFAFKGIFNSINSIFFGNGIGSFGPLFKKEDVVLYPHNIFLEAWFELGILGLFITAALLILPLILKNKIRIIKLLTIYIFLIYLKTGSFDGARVLFSLYGLLLFIPENKVQLQYEN